VLWIGGALVLAALAWGGKRWVQQRGIRNNNPGNVRLVPGVTWAGQVSPAEQTDAEFVQTRAPEYGIRMIARILKTYGSKAGLPGVGGPSIDTVQEIISRWAPPSENDTAAYIESVRKALGVPSAQTAIDIAASLPVLVPAIIQHENGVQPYSAATLARGIEIA
jgi:hypothetical protein